MTREQQERLKTQDADYGRPAEPSSEGPTVFPSNVPPRILGVLRAWLGLAFGVTACSAGLSLAVGQIAVAFNTNVTEANRLLFISKALDPVGLPALFTLLFGFLFGAGRAASSVPTRKEEVVARWLVAPLALFFLAPPLFGLLSLVFR